MPPHIRNGLIFVLVCIVIGALLAASVSFDDRSQETDIASSSNAVGDFEDNTESEESPRISQASVFNSEEQGSISCQAPGGPSFPVDWNAVDETAVAYIDNTPVSGSFVQDWAPSSNTIESYIEIHLEEDGHQFSMTIDDMGEMRVSFDGQETKGKCTPT